MKPTSSRWPAFCLLALILAALGTVIVPANYNALWGDPSFTDWITPIANQLDGHARLYEQGLHSPLPPLPFVLVRLLRPHGAVWLDASLLNYCFQAAMILLLFLAFARRLGTVAAFGAALAVMPVYFGMPKTILYDSMAQFLIAACGVTAMWLVQSDLETEGRGSRSLRWLPLAILGFLLALLMLTKQNCGVGAILGAMLTLLFLPRGANCSRRGANIFAMLLFTHIFFCVIALALNHFISFSGLIQDVLLTGSDPKGGGAHLIKILAVFFGQMGIMMAGVYLLAVVFSACIGAGFPSLAGISRWMMPNADDSAFRTSPSGQTGIFAAGLAGAALGLGLVLLSAKTGISLRNTLMEGAWGTLVLNVGLGLNLLIAVCIVFPALAARGYDLGRHPLAPCALIFVFGALFHNLSTSSLYWTHANNPLLFSALAVVFAACARSDIATGKTAHPFLFPALTAFIIFSVWPYAQEVTRDVLRCTRPWPEIKYLAGAKMRSENSDLRTLAQTVDSLAGPNDTVLMLPDDPNVETWFERKRPNLSSAIIFTDQYWDRFVDQDFAELQGHPPRVIIIGPRSFWRPFSEALHPHRGAERLIDLVQEKLLPQSYDLREAHKITYQIGFDFMDVYVRRSP